MTKRLNTQTDNRQTLQIINSTIKKVDLVREKKLVLTVLEHRAQQQQLKISFSLYVSKTVQPSMGPIPQSITTKQNKNALMCTKFCLDGTRAIEIPYAPFNYMHVRCQVVLYL